MLRTGVAVLLAVAVAVAPGAEAGPLFDAAARGDTWTVQELLAGTAPVDEPGLNAETPLMAAALNDHPEVAERLLAAGADVMARNKGGLTPLHAAAYGGSVAVARLLLDKGAMLEDRENVAGATPLQLAAEQDNVAVATLLIERGADLALTDREGFTPLTVAFWKRRNGAVRLLKQHGAACQPAEVLGSEELHRQCVAAGS
jgi:ankyrin repeat protein